VTSDPWRTRPPAQPATQQGWGDPNRYAQQQYHQPYQQLPQQRQPPRTPHPQHPLARAPHRKRRVWPYVVVGVAAVVIMPLVVLAACGAALKSAGDSIQATRAGGTVALGQTFTYGSGLALGVSVPVPHPVSNKYIVDPKTERAFAVNVKITNGTDRPVGAALVTVNATIAGKPVERIFDDGAQLVSQDVAPGQSLEFEARFKAPKTSTGDLQVAATGEFNEPVFFTGQIT
jgi:hypothetical protein